MRGTEDVGPERLWGLDSAEARSLGGRDDGAVVIDDLDGVGHRHTGNGSVGATDHGVDHTPVQLGFGERPGRIVDADHGRIRGDRSQTSTDAGTPGRTSGDATLAGCVRRRNDDDHTVAGRCRDPARPIDHPLVAEGLVLLRASEPLTGAATDDHGPDHRPDTGGVIHRVEGSTVDGIMSDHVERLSRTSFFADAAPELLRRVADAGTERALVRGDVLFNEGDPPDALYLVVSGRIAIAMSSPVDRRESVVALMEAGDLFGELGMLDDGPRSAMARALESSIVLEIPFGPVRELFHEDPRLLWNVTRLLATRLRVMDEVLADSVFLDVTGRTAKRLLELANGADQFQLPVTQEELAGMVGASRERVNKAIASFIRLGWLEQHDRTYRIVQRDRLELRSR